MSNFVSISTLDQRYFNVDPLTLKQRWSNVEMLAAELLFFNLLLKRAGLSQTVDLLLVRYLAFNDQYRGSKERD